MQILAWLHEVMVLDPSIILKYLTTMTSYVKDATSKVQLVLDAIATRCLEPSDIHELREIRKALATGDRLTASVLSGGKTNYAYKVTLQNDQSLALFAKLTFPFALFNPDKSQTYTIERTKNEFLSMNMVSTFLGADAPVAKPYACIDINKDCRLLVTEWASADQLFAYQFVQGAVDERVIDKCATTLGRLNLIDIPKDFNQEQNSCHRSIIPQCKVLFANAINQPGAPCDDFVALGRKMGSEEFNRLLDKMDKDFDRQETMIHGDFHSFNILVEAGSATESGGTVFGEKGRVYFCDWEVAHSGPLGRDPGVFCGFPLICSFCYAIRGDREKAYGLIHSVNSFWDTYNSVLENGGKNEKDLEGVFRTTLTWISFKLVFVCYLLGIFQDVMPLDDVSEKDKRVLMGTFAAFGLKIMSYGCDGKDSEMCLEDLLHWFRSLVRETTEKLLQRSTAQLSKRLSCTEVAARRSSVVSRAA